MKPSSFEKVTEADMKDDWNGWRVMNLAKEYLKTRHTTRVWTFQEILLPKIVIHVVPDARESPRTSIIKGIRRYTRAVKGLHEEGREWREGDRWAAFLGWMLGPNTVWAAHERCSLSLAPDTLPLGTLIKYASADSGGRSSMEMHDQEFLNAVGGDMDLPILGTKDTQAIFAPDLDISQTVVAISDHILKGRVIEIPASYFNTYYRTSEVRATSNKWRISESGVSLVTAVWRECDLGRSGMEYYDHDPYNTPHRSYITTWEKKDGGVVKKKVDFDEYNCIDRSKERIECSGDSCSCGREPDVVFIGCRAHLVEIKEGKPVVRCQLPFKGNVPTDSCAEITIASGATLDVVGEGWRR
ncbi:hypothetical protein HDV00_009810 [Rhizophlyctis rosea]|nr:hypothetical protein HDV00_009810 [Rhizophlyctis rosea]